MLTSAVDVARALSGTVLAGREVLQIEIPGTNDVAFFINCDGTEPKEGWRAARSVCDVTGRYPSIGTEYGGLASMVRSSGRGDRLISVDEVLSRADSVDVRSVLDARYFAPPPAPMWRICLHELDLTSQALGVAPSAEELIAAVGPNGDWDAAEWWLLNWELEHGDPRASKFVRSRARYSLLDEPINDPRFVCLWPTAVSWHLGAYVDYYAAEGREHELCATLRRWESEYDAEVIGIDAVSIDLAVGRPPVTVDDAWQLAANQFTWGTQNCSRRHLALGLLDSPTWTLFHRP